MLDILVPVLIAAAGLGALVHRQREWSRGDEIWKKAAEALGARFTPRGPFQQRRLDSLDGDFWFRVQTFSYSDGDRRKSGTRFVVGVRGGLPSDCHLRPGRRGILNEDIRYLLGGRGPELLTGADGFDASIEGRGDVRLLAVLDHETRALLIEAFESGRISEIDENGVSVSLRKEIDKPGQIVKRVQWMKRLVDRLRNPAEDTARRLAVNAAQDPVARVRHANLIALQNLSPGSEIAVEASRAALQDSAPEIRLAGALALGTEGFETLATLATAEQGLPPELRVESLRQLLGSAPRETILPVVNRLLNNASWDVRREAIVAAGKLRHTEALPRLLAQLDGNDSSVAAVVARALGEIGDARAESRLVELLRSADTDVVISAAEALGRMGSVTSVEPLSSRIAETPTSRRLTTAVTEAIAAIQGRQSGAQRGQFALSDPAGSHGQLSVTDASDRGEISIQDSTSAGPGSNPPVSSEAEPRS